MSSEPGCVRVAHREALGGHGQPSMESEMIVLGVDIAKRKFDCALLMRDIPHEWHALRSIGSRNDAD